MSLTIDGSATGGAASGGGLGQGFTTTVTLTTSLTNDIIVLYVVTCGHSATPGNQFGPVQEVTDTAGLTWKRRQVIGLVQDQNLEIWWAHAASALSSDVITVKLPAYSNQDIALAAFGVNGANTSSPWDANTSLPSYKSNGGSGSPIATYSTTAADTMVLAFWATDGAFGTSGGIPSGFTDAIGGSFTKGNAGADVAYEIQSSAQTNVNVQYSAGTNSNDRTVLVDAIVASGMSGGGVGPTAIFDGEAIINSNGSVTTANTTTNSGTNITTFSADTVLFCFVSSYTSGTSQAVSSVTLDPLGLNLSFTKRGSVTLSGTPNMSLELWWLAPGQTLSTKEVSVTMAGAVGDMNAVIFGIDNVTNTSSPFDSHSGLPASATNSSSALIETTGVSTTATDTLIIAAAAETQNDNQLFYKNAAPLGCIGNVRNTGGTNDMMLGVFAQQLSSAASSQTISTGQTNSNWLMLTDAVAVTPPAGPPGGTWVSTETADHMTCYGRVNQTLPAPQLDGSATGTSFDTDEVIVTLTTFSAGDIVVLNIFNSNAAGPESPDTQTVLHITDTANLEWHQRAHYQAPIGNHTNQEVWWAYAPNPLDADEITIVFTNNIDDASVSAQGFYGCNLSAPWDSDVSLPAYNYANHNPAPEPNVTISTISATAILLAMYGSVWIWDAFVGAGFASASSPWQIAPHTDGGTTDGNSSAYTDIAYLEVQGEGAVDVVGTSTAVSDSWSMIGDALIPPGIVFDGIGVGGALYSPDDQVTITTQGDGDIVLLWVYVNSASGVTVSTVTDTDGLTWHKRTSKKQSGQYYYITSGGTVDGYTSSTIDLELWWASKPTHGTTTITVEFSGSFYITDLLAQGVNGVNPISPWDTNASLPAAASGTAAVGNTTPVAGPSTGDLGQSNDNLGVGNTFSTTAAQTFCVSVAASTGMMNWGGSELENSSSPDGAQFDYNYWDMAALIIEGGLTPNFTVGGGPIVMSEYLSDQLLCQYKIFSTAQTNQKIGVGGPMNLVAPNNGDGTIFNCAWISITDALVAGFSAPPVYGTWASTESKDTFLAAGLGPSPRGTWASTEAPDRFSAIGFGGPITGTWASTESKDKFAAFGFINFESGETPSPPKTNIRFLVT